MRLWRAQLLDWQLPQANRARKYPLTVFNCVIQRSSVVERSAVNLFRTLFLFSPVQPRCPL